MIALILAGGFAKRMWPLTKDTPKPLLKVSGKPMIEHIIKKLERLDIKKIYISTNSKFGPIFDKWLAELDSDREIKLIVEPPVSEGEKFGAIGGLKFFLDKEDIQDDFIMINGDNLFEDELSYIHEFYREKKAPVFGLSDVKSISEARKLGTAKLDTQNKVVDFVEKSPKPTTTLASTGIYIFPAITRDRVGEYLAQEHNPDAPGFFINWLRHKTDVFGFVLTGRWFDVGSVETYERAQKEYRA